MKNKYMEDRKIKEIVVVNSSLAGGTRSIFSDGHGMIELVSGEDGEWYWKGDKLKFNGRFVSTVVYY